MPSFRRKKELKEENLALVREQLSQADGMTSLEIYVDNPDKEIPDFRILIKQWVKEGKLEGYMTKDGKAFVSRRGILKALEEELERGRVEVLRIAKRLQLPVGHVKETLILHLNASEISGFWDYKERIFLTEKGAKQAILDLSRGLNLRKAADVAADLEWETDQVINTLELLAEDHIFRGFLDANGIIHETTSLRVDLLSGGERAEKLLAGFCEERILENGYASLCEVKGVFGLNRQELRSVIEGKSFRSSTSRIFRASCRDDIIYEPISQLELFFKVLLTHQRFPLTYLVERAGLPKGACRDLLEIIANSFSHISLDGDIIEVQNFATLLRTGVDLNSLIEMLQIPRTQVIRILVRIFRPSKSYLWIKGDLHSFASSFSFICDSENTEKKFPKDKAVICLNCGYQECFECFTAKKESKACSRCGALRAFLLEFPRECPSCLASFNNSENLFELRLCPVCKDEIPMPVEPYKEEPLDVYHCISLESLKNAFSPEELSKLLECSTEEVISILEAEILRNFPSEYAIKILSFKDQMAPASYRIQLIHAP
ncbi:MAG: hypothetical protein ACFFB3_09445 [Candidatus Hodarchaeota archaeon]